MRYRKVVSRPSGACLTGCLESGQTSAGICPAQELPITKSVREEKEGGGGWNNEETDRKGERESGKRRLWTGYGAYGLDTALMDWMRRFWTGCGAYGLDAALMDWMRRLWTGYGAYGLDAAWSRSTHCVAAVKSDDAAVPDTFHVSLSSDTGPSRGIYK